VLYLAGGEYSLRQQGLSSMTARPALAICGVLSVILALPGAARAADANHGAELAKRWCANCHIVSADQKSGSTQAPPFSAIAKRQRFDQSRLAFFLLDPHPKMPDMGLSRNDAGDLAAYIATQKK
jgi:mono/diheme cytochrome c family protein